MQFNPWAFNLSCSYFLWIETSPPRRGKEFRETLKFYEEAHKTYKTQEAQKVTRPMRRYGELCKVVQAISGERRLCRGAACKLNWMIPEMPLLGVIKRDRMGLSVKELPRSSPPVSDTSPMLSHLTPITLLVYQIDSAENFPWPTEPHLGWIDIFLSTSPQEKTHSYRTYM